MFVRTDWSAAPAFIQHSQSPLEYPRKTLEKTDRSWLHRHPVLEVLVRRVLPRHLALQVLPLRLEMQIRLQLAWRHLQMVQGPLLCHSRLQLDS
jgi:hypothetical protein